MNKLKFLEEKLSVWIDDEIQLILDKTVFIPQEEKKKQILSLVNILYNKFKKSEDYDSDELKNIKEYIIYVTKEKYKHGYGKSL